MKGFVLFSFFWRLGALALVFWAAFLPLSMFIIRVHEGLYEDPLFYFLGIGSALLVFPALIFLSWFDVAVGSIVPLVMLAMLFASLEMTDPEYGVPVTKVFSSRSILVTGGNRGIGLEVAKKFLQNGGDVVITARSQNDKLAAELGAVGPGKFLGTVLLDLASETSVETFVERLSPVAKTLDVAVLNAGLGGNYETLEGHTEGIAQVNFVNNARLALALLPLLKVSPNGNATIIFSSSAMSRKWDKPLEELLDLKNPLSSAGAPIFVDMYRYARSKALLNALALKLGELHQDVRVYSALPGPTFTDMFAETMRDMGSMARYPWFCAPGTPLFEAFVNFWGKVLTRPVERVAMQYLYGAWDGNELERNGCSYFTEKCCKPMPVELQSKDSVLPLVQS